MSESFTVGDGCTINYISDREPGTIIYISKNRNKIVIQYDKWTRTDKNGLSELQEYTYEVDPSGTTVEAFKRKNGRFYLAGRGAPVITIGVRRKYFDPSF